jgi:hypothetical protein
MAAPGEKSFCALEYHTSKSVVTVQHTFRAKYAEDFIMKIFLKNCAFRDAVHRHHQGVLYVQNIALFRGRRLNVITFTAIIEGRPSLCRRFGQNSEMLSSILCAVSCVELRPNMTAQTRVLLNHPMQTAAFTVAGLTTITETQQIFVDITYTVFYLNYTNNT